MSKLKTIQHLCLILSFFSFSTLQAAIIYVDSAASGAHNGSSWTDAYKDLQNALGSAGSGDEIWVVQGTYCPSITGTLTERFTVADGVGLYGGFAGGEVARSARDYVNNVTILSGDLDKDGTLANNSYTVVYTIWVSSSTVIDGFTITGGNADDPVGSNPTPNRSGGGFYNDGFSNPSHPTVKNCIFDNNNAGAFGGAVYNNGNCISDYENCVFKNNTAFGGGAIYNAGAFLKNCSPVLKKCNFENNYGSSVAGAVYNDGNIGESSPTFKSCLFTLNHTDSTAVTYGGAIYNLGKSGKSNPTFYNCIFNTNTTFAGGAVYSLGQLGESNPTLINCTFYKNIAAFNGGALYANAGGSSSGVSNMNVNNCIFKKNRAGPSGGDIFRNNYGCISIDYSIVDKPDRAALSVGSGKAVVCGANMYYDTVDPMFEDVSSNDFRLKSTSAAIDVGENTPIDTVGITEDIASNTRIDNSIIDLGAYEYQSAPLPIELADFSATLEEAKVQLSWITLSETNNDYFVIERSVDGLSFDEILQVKGAGTSLNSHQYFEQDLQPLHGNNYYRLKQVGYDGQYSYSAIQIVRFLEVDIHLFPNPVVETINLSFSKPSLGDLRVEVRNMRGELIYRLPLAAGSRSLNFRINQLRTLIQGSYLLSVFDENQLVKSMIFQKASL